YLERLLGALLDERQCTAAEVRELLREIEGVCPSRDWPPLHALVLLALFPSPTVVLDPKTGKAQLDAPYEHFDARWYAALETVGISNFRFHDLRHATASMLAAEGASLLEIADLLGHKTLAMVKRYSAAYRPGFEASRRHRPESTPEPPFE